MPDGRKPVRNNEAGASGQHLCDGVLDDRLRFGIDRRGGLIQYKDARVCQHDAGKGNQLLLPRREQRAALADIGLIALFKPFDKAVGTDKGCGCFDLLHGASGRA